jgi:hypothetical protein
MCDPLFVRSFEALSALGASEGIVPAVSDIPLSLTSHLLSSSHPFPAPSTQANHTRATAAAQGTLTKGPLPLRRAYPGCTRASPPSSLHRRHSFKFPVCLSRHRTSQPGPPQTSQSGLLTPPAAFRLKRPAVRALCRTGGCRTGRDRAATMLDWQMMAMPNFVF